MLLLSDLLACFERAEVSRPSLSRLRVSGPDAENQLTAVSVPKKRERISFPPCCTSNNGLPLRSSLFRTIAMEVDRIGFKMRIVPENSFY